MNKFIRGDPAFVGKATGKIIKVDSIMKLKEKKGRILVVKNLTPDLTPFLFDLEGIIIEMGGILTHGTIVARELKIPCIVGVKNATSLFSENQSIEMDGGTGEINY